MLTAVRTVVVRVPVVVTAEPHPSATDRTTAHDGAGVLVVEPGARDDAEIGERDLSVSHRRSPSTVPGAASMRPQNCAYKYVCYPYTNRYHQLNEAHP